MTSPDSYFHARSLAPLEWAEVLRRVEARLGGDSTDFARLHRAFVAYPAEHTARAFYDFVARRGLHDLLVCQRFARLIVIGAALEQLPLSGARVLDFGAGGGFLASWLRDTRACEMTVSDLSPATEEALAAQGFRLLRNAARDGEESSFDFILCADSLGEIHADEDDWLSDAGNAGDENFADEMEARYGFETKLAALRPRLASGGSILLFEPVALEHFWRGAARLLERAGWRVEILGPQPAWGLRIATP